MALAAGLADPLAAADGVIGPRWRVVAGRRVGCSHRDWVGVLALEPGFDPRSYWRGPAWPQLSYLVWVGLRRQGRREAAEAVASTTVRGAMRSGFAEYWDPDDGTGGGAVPQSWTALAALMA